VLDQVKKGASAVSCIPRGIGLLCFQIYIISDQPVCENKQLEYSRNVQDFGNLYLQVEAAKYVYKCQLYPNNILLDPRMVGSKKWNKTLLSLYA
jgi:hypothetical protein